MQVVLVVFLSVMSCLWLPAWSDNTTDICPQIRQSPIPLLTDNATKNDELNIKFSLGYYKVVVGTVTNDGHAVLIELAYNKNPPYVENVLPGEKFVFGKIYIIWPSDHTIDGKRYDSEIQVIHYREKYGSLENAVNKPDGLFILARLYKKSWRPNIQFVPVVYAIVKASHKPHVPIKSFGLPRAIIPFRDQSFFRYKDSGLAPGCYETTTWQVYASPSSYSNSQHKKITTIYDSNGKLIKTNNRKLQPVNGRDVSYRKYKWF